MYRPVFLLAVALVAVVSGHMRLHDPAGRASLYWYPEFAYLDPVLWVLDDAMWCGNMRQFENDTRCGVSSNWFLV